MKRVKRGMAAVVGLAVHCAAAAAQPAQEGTPWQPIEQLSTQVVHTGNTIWCGSPPGDSSRLFVASGPIQVFTVTAGPDGAKVYTPLAQPFLPGGSFIRSVAFAPDYATSGYFYVAREVGGSCVIDRHRRSDANPNVADAAPPTPIMRLPGIQGDHAVGSIHFGPDGLLYIGAGDGHFPTPAQNLTQIAGKMLRIDVSRDDFPNDPLRNYGIPAGNPFPISTATNAPRPEVIVAGLRNPWRWSFDRATGKMWIGDVGASHWEEINVIGPFTAPISTTGMINLGWPNMEGPSGSSLNLAPGTRYVKPTFWYQHGSNTPWEGRFIPVGGNSITGGFVYRGTAIPSLRGWYIFGDYGSRRVWATSAAQPWIAPREITAQLSRLTTGAAAPLGSIVSFGEDAAGEIFICTWGQNALRKIVPAPPPGFRAPEVPHADGDGQAPAVK